MGVELSVTNMVSWRNAFVAMSLLCFVVAGETGPCRYEDTVCSCKLGLAGQGRCWDRISSKPGFCRQRPCLQGWTCTCTGRTHLCARAPLLINVVAQGSESSTEAPCDPTPIPQVSEPSLKLGNAVFAFSRKGVAADMCTQITWWQNGLFRGDWNRVSDTLETDAKIDAALIERSKHTLLELRPGDLIAFQITEGSYHCYSHFSGFEVNGLNITTEMLGVTSHYAREFSTNWFDPSVTLNSSNTAANETELDLTKFLPPRTKMRDGSVIEPKVDYWQPDGDNMDHLIGDWFWRIRIPTDLIDPFSSTF